MRLLLLIFFIHTLFEKYKLGESRGLFNYQQGQAKIKAIPLYESYLVSYFKLAISRILCTKTKAITLTIE